jgi:ABC transport system ATP-binding/permease protein
MENVITILSGIFQIAEFILFTIGLWQIFKKCNVKKKWALFPVLRVFRLSECADVDEIGIPWFIMELLLGIGQFLEALDLPEKATTVLTLIVGPIAIAVLFFRLRAYYHLCKVFQVKKKKIWTILWVTLSGFSAMVFGFSDKFQPSKTVEDNDEDKEEKEAAITREGKLEILDEGLTVDIRKRVVSSRLGLKKKTLLRDITMNIEPGNMVLLLGGSGAGKTTFLNAVTGYEPADAEVYLNGHDVYKEFNAMQHDIGFVPQQDLMRYNDTVKHTITDFAKLRLPKTVKKEELNAKVDEVLDIFGLQPVKESDVGKLSGGQKKRASIAMEFVTSPSLFILDEPDSGLDGVLARDLMERLHKISRTGKIVIVITHSPDRVLDLFDKVIVLAKDEAKTGRLVFYGPTEKAKEFFGKDKMQDVIKMINREEEGGEGKADELLKKFEAEEESWVK